MHSKDSRHVATLTFYAIVLHRWGNKCLPALVPQVLSVERLVGAALPPCLSQHPKGNFGFN